jgi:DNA-directed RNA polymerase subunit RPC12/RpoP
MVYFKAKCQHCGKEFLIKDIHLGQNMICPHCGEISRTLGLENKVEKAGNIPIAEPAEGG